MLPSEEKWGGGALQLPVCWMFQTNTEAKHKKPNIQLNWKPRCWTSDKSKHRWESSASELLIFFLFALKTEKLGVKSLNKLRQKYRFQGTIFGLCFFPRITLSIWQSSVYSVSISMGFTSCLFLAVAKLQPTHTILENTHGCSSSPKRMTKDSTVVLSCFYLSVFLLHWNLFNNACKLLRKPDSKTV